ncbi:MAG: hypothetical protein V4550_15850 [Gemmatimonadota bacterium]
MNDEFDDLINDAKRTYNVPPVVPREAMWEAISRARAEAAAAPIAAARQGQRWISAAAGIAAVLVVGIAIGRASKEQPATSSTVATANPVAPATGTDSNVPAASNGPSAASYGPGPASRPPTNVRRELAQRAPKGGSAASQSASDRSADQTAYRLAVVEHLTRTEVLLTGFRAQARSGGDARVDAQFASLSRELLGTTRLLLATRRGDDPAITRLLEDLELILMQLSQYAADGRRTDLDAINQSLEKRNVLPKLRSTIPAGVSASAGTE